MNRERELVKSTIIISIGQFLPQLFNLILIPVLTKNLLKQEYGTYDFILALVSLLLPIVTLQIQSAAFRFLIDVRGNVEECKKIISSIFFFTISVSFIVIVISYFAFPSLDRITRVILGFYLCADILYTVFGQALRGLADTVGFAIGAIILAAVKTIFVVLTLLVFQQGLKGVLLAIVIGYFMSDLFLFLKGKLYQYIAISSASKYTIKSLIQYSWPMIPNNLSSWILKISDRFIITLFLGVEANAVYAAANNIPGIINVAKGVVVMAWQENASIAVKDEDASNYFSKMFRTMFALIAGITALMIGFSPILFKLLIRGDYAAAYEQMPILYIGVFFGCISAFQGGIYIAHKKTKSVGITTLVAAIINLVIDIALVNLIGIYAGSISTLISYFVLFIYRLFDVKSFQEIQYSYKEIICLLGILITMSLMGMSRNICVSAINCLIGVVFACVINWDFLKGFTRIMRKKYYEIKKV